MSAGSAGPGCWNLAQAPPRQAPPRQAPPTQASRPGRPSKLLSDPAAWFRLISACLAEGSEACGGGDVIPGLHTSPIRRPPPPPPPQSCSQHPDLRGPAGLWRIPAAAAVTAAAAPPAGGGASCSFQAGHVSRRSGPGLDPDHVWS